MTHRVTNLIGYGSGNVAASGSVEQGGVDFDGSTGYADTTLAGGLSSGSGPFTILCWANLDTLGDYEALVEVGDTNIGIMADGDLTAHKPGAVSYLTTGTPASTGSWQQFVMTHAGGALNATNTKVYHNATNYALSLDGGSGTPVLSTAGHIGKNETGTDKFADGEIAQVALWDEVLTAAEITALYNSGTPYDPQSDHGDYTSSAGLVHHWPMNEGSGTTLDDTQTATDATLTGTYTWTTTGLTVVS